MPSQCLTRASSHLIGPAPVMILKSTYAVVGIHCVLGIPSGWTVYSELVINYRGKPEMDEREIMSV